MTERSEIERLLNKTGRTLECIPNKHSMADLADAARRPEMSLEVICQQSDVIELLVDALRDALNNQTKWNSVNDSLPTGFYVDECGYKEPEEYIVFIKGASVPTSAMYDGKNFIGICEGHEFVAEVTHWMPFQALQLPLEVSK